MSHMQYFLSGIAHGTIKEGQVQEQHNEMLNVFVQDQCDRLGIPIEWLHMPTSFPDKTDFLWTQGQQKCCACDRYPVRSTQMTCDSCERVVFCSEKCKNMARTCGRHTDMECRLLHSVPSSSNCWILRTDLPRQELKVLLDNPSWIVVYEQQPKYTFEFKQEAQMLVVLHSWLKHHEAPCTLICMDEKNIPMLVPLVHEPKEKKTLCCPQCTSVMPPYLIHLPRSRMCHQTFMFLCDSLERLSFFLSTTTTTKSLVTPDLSNSSCLSDSESASSSTSSSPLLSGSEPPSPTFSTLNLDLNFKKESSQE